MSVYWYTVAFILLIVIVILLFHCELFRYMKLHYDDENDYISNYGNVDDNCYVGFKVVVSLTSTPDRIRKIKPMLKSILNQSVRVDEIALNIPYECKGKRYDIPDEILNIAKIYYTGKDYGSGTKFLSTVLREGDVGTIIILLDDDYIYGYEFIETILKESLKTPNIALYTKGAILLKPEFVKEDIIDITKSYIDDETIMKYLNVDKKKFNYFNNYRSFMM
jgi:hypothetical protein